MRNIIKSIGCLAIVAALSACGDNRGYYDSAGNYRDYGANDARSATPGHSGESYYGNNYYTDHNAMRGDSKRVIDYDRARDREIMPYKRRGYYDYHGDYVPSNRAPTIDAQLLPKRGMCRVWFPERNADEQPAVENCKGIQTRVPYGAYVIYGG